MGSSKENDKSFRNILIFSVGFMLLMAAWMAMAAIEQTILQSVQVEVPSFRGDGYISLAVINGVFAVTNFFTPMIVSLIGVRTSLVLSSSAYAVFIASFLYPNTWLLYGTSALIGFTASIVWVSNGIYFTRCSTKETIGKNMGIYWVIMCSGQLIGNAFVFWKFQGKNHIDEETRYAVLLVLTCVSSMATVTFIFLGPPRYLLVTANRKSDTEFAGEASKVEKKATPNFCTIFVEPFRLLKNKHMLLLIPPAMYNGLEIAFFISLYPTAVGFTEEFGEDAKKLVGFAGIIIGVGSVAGGLIFGVFGDKVVNSKRQLIMGISCVCHCICFILTYLNLPNDAPLGPTKDISWINPPSVPIAMVCAFLLGIGDGCVSPQLVAAIGVIWMDDPSAAFAIYRFIQGASCAAGFFISTMTGLYNQLLIFLVVTVAGTITFWINEILIEKKDKKIVKAVMQISIIPSKLSLTNDLGK